MSSKHPPVLTELETLERAHAGESLARYGDGELKLALGRDCISQKADPRLAAELQQVLHAKAPVLPCIPSPRNAKGESWARFATAGFLALYDPAHLRLGLHHPAGFGPLDRHAGLLGQGHRPLARPRRRPGRRHRAVLARIHADRSRLGHRGPRRGQPPRRLRPHRRDRGADRHALRPRPALPGPHRHRPRRPPGAQGRPCPGPGPHRHVHAPRRHLPLPGRRPGLSRYAAQLQALHAPGSGARTGPSTPPRSPSSPARSTPRPSSTMAAASRPSARRWPRPTRPAGSPATTPASPAARPCPSRPSWWSAPTSSSTSSRPASTRSSTTSSAWHGKGAYLIAATRPAKAVLPDGRNAHLIVQSEDWWLQKIAAVGATAGGWRIERAVQRPGRDITLWLRK
jgi:hypothetical protein